ncbi:MAG TPA: cupin domain-containing protein [Candidatus Tumulicola sp.]|jgi:mannose-6-phosphate isomerase-like protein (cupin superfamily)
MQKVNLNEKFAAFDDTWHPKIVGELNDFHVKLVRVDGEFVWHHHDSEDELFMVIEGEIAMHYRDASGEHIERFGPGEFLIMPHGVEHKPVATMPTKMLLLEPKTTVNTGTAGGEKTALAEWI